MPDIEEGYGIWILHQNQFKTPEYRKLTAIFLDPVDLAKELTPPEARIKEEYDYRKEVRTKPERRSLEQVLFQDQDKAETFYNQVTIHVIHNEKIMNVKVFNNGRVQITKNEYCYCCR